MKIYDNKLTFEMLKKGINIGVWKCNVNLLELRREGQGWMCNWTSFQCYALGKELMDYKKEYRP